jgi:predicted amidohydrolase YtcJ
MAVRAQRAPDLILVNGHIWTGDAQKPWVEALSVSGDKVRSLGDSVSLALTADAHTRVVDLNGAMAMPGINDAHEHIGGAPFGVEAKTAKPPMADPAMDEVAGAVKTAVATTKPGEWIEISVGPAVIRHPEQARSALDAAAGDHPVIAEAWWGHGAVLNGVAMRRIGLADDAKDPPGGHYVRDADGQIVLLEEAAATMVERKLGGEGGAAAAVPGIRAYAEHRLKEGVTSVQVMDTNAPLDVLGKTFVDAATPLRVRIMKWPLNGETVRAGEEVLSPSVRIAGIKYVMDGTPIEELAFRTTDYPDKPGWRGRPDYPVAFIDAQLRAALTGKDQLLMHIVGDAMTDEVLEEMEKLASAGTWRPLRVRFEHGDGFTTPERMARAKKLGIIVAQPRPGRPWKTLVDSGIPLAYGSDNGMAPWFMFGVMTDAKNPQAISREQALSILTSGPAFAEFQEKKKGELAPGMYADVIVLSQDVTKAPQALLAGTKSAMTIIGGKVVYDAAKPETAK